MARSEGWVRAACVGVAVLSPVASNSALALGRGYGVAVAFAALQAVAAGVLLWGALPRWRWVGAAVAAVLLGGLAAGGARSAADGLLVAAGSMHAMLYAGLLAVFGRTLVPGRESLVTGFARRLNPTFHAGMVPYTRGVTWAWCGFFGLQLVASAGLLLAAPGLWRAFVTSVHAPLVLLMALAEFGVRRWRWRHEHSTGLRATITGVRRIGREAAAGARTSRRA